jgi:hypothetical protein
MKRKNIGQVTKRYTVYKHISQWDGNFRCHVWELIFQSDDRAEAWDYYRQLEKQLGYYEINDEHLSSAKCISATT